jgi:hypothetical protein
LDWKGEAYVKKKEIFIHAGVKFFYYFCLRV